MIQDIAPHVFDNQIVFTKPAAHDCVLVYRDRVAADPHNSVLARRGDAARLEFPTFAQLDTDCPCVYAFSVDGERFFVARPEKDVFRRLPPQAEGYGFVHMKDVRESADRARAFAAITGFHLHEWYRDNVRCGRCGKLLAYSHAERALECRSCGNILYPKIAPAVIVAVVDGEKILLTKYAWNTESPKRALVAGFVEIGETAEQTAEREVREEVGLRVKNIRYYKSQPWGYASNLLLGYFCELDGDATITLQEDELGYGAWVSRDEITEEEDGVTLTSEMIARFKRGDQPFSK